MKRSIAILALGALLTGCSLQDHVDEASAKIAGDYANVKLWDELPQRVISWQQAVAMMKKNNAEMLAADSKIRKAERDELSVYTDMIPGLSYYGYFTRSINALSEAISADDMNSRVNMTFSIPTLTQVPYRVYENKARAFAAIKAKEGKMRELESKLYKMVRTQEVEARLAAHESTNPDKKEEDMLLRKGEDTNKQWKEIAELLGNYEARWQILPSSVPRVRWSEYLPKMKKLDPLVICNFAMQLEQARMGQYSVALRYLPTINTNLYSPSLFASSGGTYEGTFLDGEDTRINLSVSYMLDTKMRIWEQYENSKERFEAAKRTVLVGMIDHKNKMQQLRKSVREYNNWRNYMHKRMDFVSNMPTTTSEDFLGREKALYDMKKELLTQEKAAIESEAAVVLEYGMPGKS